MKRLSFDKVTVSYSTFMYAIVSCFVVHMALVAFGAVPPPPQQTQSEITSSFYEQ